MWERKELKDNAKAHLGKYYWNCVLMALIAMIIGAGGFGGGSFFSGDDEDFSTINNASASGVPDMRVLMPILIAVLVVCIIIFVFSTIYAAFIRNPLTVGIKSFYVKCRYGTQQVDDLAFSFKKNYLNIVLVMFLKEFFIGLWSIAFMIPGIFVCFVLSAAAGPAVFLLLPLCVIPSVVKSYEYLMIPYILTEHPEMHYKDVFALSRAMMQGQKWDAFVLGLSFIGWNILSVFTLFILALFYVTPYTELTFAELYHTLKRDIVFQTQENDMPRSI